MPPNAHRVQARRPFPIRRSSNTEPLSGRPSVSRPGAAMRPCFACCGGKIPPPGESRRTRSNCHSIHSVRYRPEIDGLRALAVAAVVLFHAGFSSFSGGFLGVDVFFVISGYLITSIILTDLHAGTFRLAHFYERRARRILPALFLVMFACVPAAWLLMNPYELRQFMMSALSISVFASNVFFLLRTGYFDIAVDLNPLLHTWSLAV